jgi:CspA family cold shock protein
MKTTVRETGTVKSWQGTYGFIERDCNGTGIFIHQSDIVMDGYRALVPGQRVEFDIAESDRGLKAVEVQVVE